MLDIANKSDKKISFLDHNVSQMWQSFGKNITGKINSQHEETSSLLQELEQKYNLSTNEVIKKIEEQEEIQSNQTKVALNHHSNKKHEETSSLLQELEQKYNFSTNEVIRKIEEQEEIQLNQTKVALNHHSNKMKQLLNKMTNENRDMNLKLKEKIENNYRTLIEEMIITNETLDVFSTTMNHSI